MIHKITFLLHHKTNASNHLFSKQLKNLQSNHLIGGFNSIIYSSFAWGFKYGRGRSPRSSTPCKFRPTRPERAEAPSPGHRPGYNSNQQGAL